MTTLFRHRRIYDGRPANGRGEAPSAVTALAVDGRGEILARMAPSVADEVVDLPGEAVVPGLIDTHAHLSSLGGGPDDLDLRDLSAADALLDRVCADAGGRPAGAWITGTGWSDGPTWRGALPAAGALDAASGGRPVALFRRDRHAILASSSALRAAGIGPGIADPPGGRIERDPTTGDPTGLLIDAAMDPVLTIIPRPSAAEVATEARRRALGLAKMGVTCVHEAWVEPPLWEALDALARDEELALRVRAILAEPMSAPPSPPDPDRLRIIGIKGFADGALGSRGAQLGEPYADGPTRGIAVETDEALARRAEVADRLGLQLAIHAIGDEGCRRVLDLYERWAGKDPAGFFRRRRWRIEHAQMVRPEDLRRVDGLCLAVQPIHFAADAPFAPSRIGSHRLAWSHRWRTLIEAGAIVGFGSDFPIESGDPLAGIRALVASGPAGVSGWDRAAERLSLIDAFEGYWGRAAYLAFDERRLGRLLPGFLADFVCLDRDPFEAGSMENAHVVATFVGGRCVFRADGVGRRREEVT